MYFHVRMEVRNMSAGKCISFVQFFFYCRQGLHQRYNDIHMIMTISGGVSDDNLLSHYSVCMCVGMTVTMMRVKMIRQK